MTMSERVPSSPSRGRRAPQLLLAAAALRLLALGLAGACLSSIDSLDHLVAPALADDGKGHGNGKGDGNGGGNGNGNGNGGEGNGDGNGNSNGNGNGNGTGDNGSGTGLSAAGGSAPASGANPGREGRHGF